MVQRIKMRYFVSIIMAVVTISCSTTPKGNGVYYRVHVTQGDTLQGIADRFHTDWQSIARENRISNPNQLEVGQVLVVRPGQRTIAQQPQHQSSNSSQPSASSRSGLLFGDNSDEHGIPQLSTPVRGEVSSPFGMRNGRMHHGTDFRAPRGTSITAAADGRVSFSGWMRGYGRTVIVKHNRGEFSTLYAHCHQLLVKEGDWVTAGQRIATVGQTGHATGNHLHFEVRNRSGNALNPERYLPSRRQGIFAVSPER